MDSHPLLGVLQLHGQIVDVADRQIAGHLVESVFLLNDFFLESSPVVLDACRFAAGCLPCTQVRAVVQRLNQRVILLAQHVRFRHATLHSAAAPSFANAPFLRAWLADARSAQLVCAANAYSACKKQAYVLRADECEHVREDVLSTLA